MNGVYFCVGLRETFQLAQFGSDQTKIGFDLRRMSCQPKANFNIGSELVGVVPT